jgi:hypothetical protein
VLMPIINKQTESNTKIVQVIACQDFIQKEPRNRLIQTKV